MADGKKTILVVEDDMDSRNALCLILESLGHTALSFGSASEALAGVVGKHLDLAMIDIMMPEMNGYELLRELKKIPEHREVPIVMVTAKDQDSEILQGYQYGADYYITKPYTAKQIEWGIKIYLGEEDI